MTAHADIEEELAEIKGHLDPQDEDPAVMIAAAVATYLAFRRAEIGDDPGDILRLAVRAECDGPPAGNVRAWLAEQGVASSGCAARRSSPNTSTGPGPCPRSRRPSRTASEAIALAARAASSGSRPSARCAASAEECVQPDPCAAPLGIALARNLDEPLAVEEDVDGLLAVAAGDHDRPRAERVDGARELLGADVRAPPAGSPASTRASGRFGVTTVARGTSASRSASSASSSSSRAPLSATITGSSTTGTSPDEVERLAHRLDRLARAEHADLDRVDADVLDHRPHLLDDHLAAESDTPRSPPRCSGR